MNKKVHPDFHFFASYSCFFYILTVIFTLFSVYFRFQISLQVCCHLPITFSMFLLIKTSCISTRDHSFSAYAKFSEKLTFLTPPPFLSFSENFAYVLNE